MFFRYMVFSHYGYVFTYFFTKKTDPERSVLKEHINYSAGSVEIFSLASLRR